MHLVVKDRFCYLLVSWLAHGSGKGTYHASLLPLS